MRRVHQHFWPAFWPVYQSGFPKTLRSWYRLRVVHIHSPNPAGQSVRQSIVDSRIDDNQSEFTTIVNVSPSLIIISLIFFCPSGKKTTTTTTTLMGG